MWNAWYPNHSWARRHESVFKYHSARRPWARGPFDSGGSRRRSRKPETRNGIKKWARRRGGWFTPLDASRWSPEGRTPQPGPRSSKLCRGTRPAWPTQRPRAPIPSRPAFSEEKKCRFPAKPTRGRASNEAVSTPSRDGLKVAFARDPDDKFVWRGHWPRGTHAPRVESALALDQGCGS